MTGATDTTNPDQPVREGSSNPPPPPPPTLSLASLAIHADDHVGTHRAVAPAMHVSTTFRYDGDPDKLVTGSNIDPLAPNDSHIYSRDSSPNTTRLETVLSHILHGPVVTYASGLAAFHALLVLLKPRRLYMGPGGYHGCFGTARLVQRLTGMEIHPLAAAWLPDAALTAGDLVHVETPQNPTGELADVAAHARLAHARGAWLGVDATFGPPPLQDPFALGADVVVHSGTKYLGGHSDMLCGVLAVRPREDDDWERRLREDRLAMGNVMGSMEGWLGLRSVRTLELRVERQSRNAQGLVDWLASELRNDEGGAAGRVVERVCHASLQEDRGEWVRAQMPRGFGAVFAVVARSESLARRLPSRLALFHHATSLGGVESLVEWRAMTDKTVDRRLLRFSVGVEGIEDLKEDLRRAFEALAGEDGEK